MKRARAAWLRILVAAFGIVTTGGWAEGAERWVAPGGDDGGPGTAARPWRTLAAAADRARPGDTVWLGSGTWNERLVLTRSGTARAPIVFAAAPGARPVIDGAGIVLGRDLEGVVEVRDAAWIEVRGLAVVRAGPGEGAAGIHASHAEHLTVRGCATAHTASSGIGIWWSRSVLVDGNDVADACHGGSQECISIAGCDGFEVRNNVVHDSVSPDHGGEGIDAKHGANGRVHHNRVHHIARLGIYVDAWDTHTHDIEVDHNWVHDTKANGYAVAAEDGGLLERIRVHDNVAARNAHIGITVAGWGEAVPHHPIRDVVIEHNTFVDNGTSGWGGGIHLDNPEAEGVVVRRNLVAGNRTFSLLVDRAGRNLTLEGNLVADVRGEKHETRGDRPVAGTPVYRVGSDGAVTVEPPPAGDAPGARGAVGPELAAARWSFGGWISEWHQDWAVLKDHPQDFDSVAFSWFSIEKDGSLKRVAPMGREVVVGWCRDHSIKTFLTIGGGVEGISGEAGDRAIRSLVAACATLGFDGVDVDVEELPKTARAAYTDFTRRLHDALKAMTPPRLLSSTLQAVNNAEDEAGTFMDYAAVGALADVVHVMHYDDAWDAPGSLMPRDHFAEQLAFTLSKVPAAKCVPALPWYGTDWTLGTKDHEDILWRMTNNVDGILGAAEILKTFQAAPVWDEPGGELTWTYTREGKVHVVWMADPRSFAWMIDAAKVAGVAGVYVWQIEYADPKFMAVVEAKLKGGARR